MWVKVCGLSRRSDVEAAEAAGADAIGLVLSSSPRQVTPEVAERLARSTSLQSFLVLVDASPAQALDLARYAGVTGIQPHGEHAGATAAAAIMAGLSVLRPWSPTSSDQHCDIPSDQLLLLDSSVRGLHGGTGVRLDPSLIPPLERDWVLAGGLNPDNVQESIARIRPWGVDASSGLESSPGSKDPDLIKEFVERAKSQ